jgi:hypothetical protein
MIKCGLFKEGGDLIYGDITGSDQLSKDIDTQSILLYIQTAGSDIIIGSHIEAGMRKDRFVFIEQLSLSEFLRDPKKTIIEFFSLAEACIQEKRNMDIIGIGESKVPIPTQIQIMDNDPAHLQNSVASILINIPVQIISINFNQNIDFVIRIMNEIKELLGLGFIFVISDSKRAINGVDISFRKQYENPDIDLTSNKTFFSDEDSNMCSTILKIYKVHVRKPGNNLPNDSRKLLSDTIFKIITNEIFNNNLDLEKMIRNERFGVRIFLESLKFSNNNEPRTAINFNVLYRKFDQPKKKMLQKALIDNDLFLEATYIDALEAVMLKNDFELFISLQKIQSPVLSDYKRALESTCNRIAWREKQIQKQTQQILERILNGPVKNYNDAQKECVRQLFTRLNKENALNRAFFKKYRKVLEESSYIPPINKMDNVKIILSEIIPMFVVSLISIAIGYFLSVALINPVSPAINPSMMNETSSNVTASAQQQLMGISFDLNVILLIICSIGLFLAIGFFCYRRINTFR